MPKYCPDCGEENPEKARFCCNCSSLFPEQGTRKISVLNQRYEIVKLLKSGAMGSVYQAVDVNLGITVAVKKILDSNLPDDEKRYARERFREEARLLSELHHSGLPKVTDFFVENDADTGKPAHFLVMTFIDGRDLESITIARGKKPYPVDKVIDYMRQILDILRYLHNQTPPIIYRDIKPSNIMIDNGRVILVDFGIARVFTPRQKGTVIGTPGYAPPEQYKGYAEPGSDIYSLGALVHYMLTGKDPEDSASAPFFFEPAGRLNPDVPKWLEELIAKMTRTDCAARLHNAEAVLSVLKSERSIPAQVFSSNTISMEKNQVLPAQKPGLLEKITGFFELFGRKTNGNTNLKENLSDSDKNRAEPAGSKSSNTVNHKSINPDSGAIGASGSQIDRMFNFIMQGEKEEINKLLLSGFNINDSRNDKGWTPLHAAVFFRREEIAGYFIDNGADINAVENFGWTPIHIAASQGYASIIELLLRKGADISLKDKSGKLPWEYAQSRGYDSLVGVLKTSLPIRYSDLHHAVRAGDIGEVKQLLHEGADVTLKDKTGYSPLHLAAKRDNNEITNLLISLTPCPDDTIPDGKTALHLAVFYGKKDAVRMLALSGARIDSRDNEGNTPLHFAAFLGLTQIAEILIANGANPAERNNAGKTPAELAADKGHALLAGKLESTLLKDTRVNSAKMYVLPGQKKESVKGWEKESKTVITVSGSLGAKISIVELYNLSHPGCRLINRIAEEAIPEMVAGEVEVRFDIRDKQKNDFKRGFMFALGYSPIFVKAAGENPVNIQSIMEGGSSCIYIDENAVLHLKFGEILSGPGKQFSMARANLIDILVRGILRGAMADFARSTFKTPQARFKSNPLFVLGYFTSGEGFRKNTIEPTTPKFLPLTSFLDKLI